MMETVEMTLTDFLLARIAEDEATARMATDYPASVERVVWLGGSRYAPESDVPDGAPMDLGHWGIRADSDAVRVFARHLWDESEPVGAVHFIAEIPPRSSGVADHIARHDPARILAECEAKRRIVEMWEVAVMPADRLADRIVMPSVRLTLAEVARALALPYADHPDYRQEWKP